MVQVVAESPPLRADAVRNRAKIREAARVEFARLGAEAQMDDVARRAGLGVGTIYRHFPTKSALLAALIAERFEVFAHNAAAALAAEGPAFQRFAELLRVNSELMAGDAGTRHAMMAGDEATWAEDPPALPELLALSGRLVAQAQAEGTMRPDFDADEIGMLMCGICAGMDRRGKGDWHRHLEIVVDGLRARA